MAHLKCSHERRVLVMRRVDKSVVIRHREDNSQCASEFVAISTVVYSPRTQPDGPAPTVINALGPVVSIGEISEAAARAAKSKRQVKNHRVTKYRGR